MGHVEEESGFHFIVLLFPGKFQFDPHLVHLHAVFLCDIGNKNKIDFAVSRHGGVMSVIIDPADLTVLADDAVFNIIQLSVRISFDLFVDGGLNEIEVIRMDKPAEGVPCQGLEFFECVTAEDRKQSPVDIDDFL